MFFCSRWCTKQKVSYVSQWYINFILISTTDCSPALHQWRIEGMSTAFCKCKTHWNVNFLEQCTNTMCSWTGIFPVRVFRGWRSVLWWAQSQSSSGFFSSPADVPLYPTASVSATLPHRNMKTFCSPLDKIIRVDVAHSDTSGVCIEHIWCRLGVHDYMWVISIRDWEVV